jgi:hypothetical protein
MTSRKYLGPEAKYERAVHIRGRSFLQLFPIVLESHLLPFPPVAIPIWSMSRRLSVYPASLFAALYVLPLVCGAIMRKALHHYPSDLVGFT